ncbi:RloB family protein [Rivularia sp. UHCC 0363]|uniref:RloB family protein n=1 Tax=Rivularia sp. UHCC 0363 TaxID=3110244 RepID=UPI002B1FC4FA|nr:RloB family protein [Rivularia sp. UHCC 0363]MEA5598972.1 RloB family protein [Rivularia sp. UHCC 0363]
MPKRGKNSSQLQRSKGNKKPRKYILIVVEGQQTEYNYLNSLKDDLKLKTTEIKVARASGGSPLDVVEKAENLLQEQIRLSEKQEQPKYDEVICVFDQDNQIKKYNEALIKAKKYDILAITSVPCFELWFLLHCCNTSSPFSDCKQVCQKLESEFKKLGILKSKEYYEKNNSDWYKILKPKLQDAIDNAEKLDKYQENNHENLNPSTKVHILVKMLQKQKDFE